jgi:uncharacterized membrane protein
MQIPTTIRVIQIVSIVMGILGTALVFFNSPFSSGGTFEYTFGESEKRMAKAKKDRRAARMGFSLIVISCLLQVIVLFL